MLVKRPLLVGDDFVLTGFRARRNGKRGWDDPDESTSPLWTASPKSCSVRCGSQRFGGVDRYFIPFFSPTPHHLMTPRDLREVDL